MWITFIKDKIELFIYNVYKKNKMIMKTKELNPIMKPLTKEEKEYILPELVKFLKKQKSSLKTREIVKRMEEIRLDSGCLWKSKMCGVRLRKMMNWIRGNQILGVVGDDDGYLATDDIDELEKQAERMESRIESQMFQLKGTREYIKRLKANSKRDDLGFVWDDEKDEVIVEHIKEEESVLNKEFDPNDPDTWPGEVIYKK
jgi:hypothetical protein